MPARGLGEPAHVPGIGLEGDPVAQADAAGQQGFHRVARIGAPVHEGDRLCEDRQEVRAVDPSRVDLRVEARVRLETVDEERGQERAARLIGETCVEGFEGVEGGERLAGGAEPVIVEARARKPKQRAREEQRGETLPGGPVGDRPGRA